MAGELQPQRMTSAEYLSFERQSDWKHEFYRGEVFAMAGASANHNRITLNTGGLLNQQFRDRNCEAFVVDMRVKIDHSGLYTYPDIVALCGKAQFEDDVLDTLLNPQVIVEVLSKSTEGYDRGKKFRLYRELESLTVYILIAADRVSVEQFTRGEGGNWIMRPYGELTDIVKVVALDCQLSLEEIYRKVDFETEEN
jgi:Uma2 family endonuclease